MVLTLQPDHIESSRVLPGSQEALDNVTVSGRIKVDARYTWPGIPLPQRHPHPPTYLPPLLGVSSGLASPGPLQPFPGILSPVPGAHYPN